MNPDDWLIRGHLTISQPLTVISRISSAIAKHHNMRRFWCWRWIGKNCHLPIYIECNTTNYYNDAIQICLIYVQPRSKLWASKVLSPCPGPLVAPNTSRCRYPVQLFRQHPCSASSTSKVRRQQSNSRHPSPNSTNLDPALGMQIQRYRYINHTRSRHRHKNLPHQSPAMLYFYGWPALASCHTHFFE